MQALGGNVELFVTGGAAIPAHLEQLLALKMKAPFVTGYGMTEAAPLLTAAGAPSALTDLISPGVTPVCGARFTRLAKTIPLEGALVELALDQGFLLGGGRELAFAEVEVELKQGPRQDADRFAAALAREYGLVPEAKSKFKRALSLAHAPER